jgi:hypothetical protein
MDHKYQEGTFITAKENPDRKLVIHRYIKRIYYCNIVAEPEHKPLAYFERELIPPAAVS